MVGDATADLGRICRDFLVTDVPTGVLSEECLVLPAICWDDLVFVDEEFVLPDPFLLLRGRIQCYCELNQFSSSSQG